jgi:AraC family transcriptional regulator, alkane utilization regulator
MQYVTHVRFTKAAALLRTNSATLVEVATSIGYDSEVAFSKAFRRYFGMPSGAYRQGKRPPTETATLENGYHVQ